MKKLLSYLLVAIFTLVSMGTLMADSVKANTASPNAAGLHQKNHHKRWRKHHKHKVKRWKKHHNHHNNNNHNNH
jgi:Ni/Co efflux regulator RcnB